MVRNTEIKQTPSMFKLEFGEETNSLKCKSYLQIVNIVIIYFTKDNMLLII